MPDPLAHRVDVSPSSTFWAAQQPPDDDAVAGLFSDSRVSPAAAAAVAPASATRANTVAIASTFRSFIGLLTGPSRRPGRGRTRRC
jgi:hypothetical protein